MCVLLWQFLLCLPVYVHLKMVLGFVLRPCVLLSVCMDRVTDCKTQLYFCDIVKLALVSQLFSVFDEFCNQPCCRYVTVTSRFLRSLRCRQCLFLPIFLADHLLQGVKKS